MKARKRRSTFWLFVLAIYCQGSLAQLEKVGELLAGQNEEEVKKYLEDLQEKVEEKVAEEGNKALADEAEDYAKNRANVDKDVVIEGSEFTAKGREGNATFEDIDLDIKKENRQESRFRFNSVDANTEKNKKPGIEGENLNLQYGDKSLKADRLSAEQEGGVLNVEGENLEHRKLNFGRVSAQQEGSQTDIQGTDVKHSSGSGATGTFGEVEYRKSGSQEVISGKDVTYDNGQGQVLRFENVQGEKNGSETSYRGTGVVQTNGTQTVSYDSVTYSKGTVTVEARDGSSSQDSEVETLEGINAKFRNANDTQFDFGTVKVQRRDGLSNLEGSNVKFTGNGSGQSGEFNQLNVRENNDSTISVAGDGHYGDVNFNIGVNKLEGVTSSSDSSSGSLSIKAAQGGGISNLELKTANNSVSFVATDSDGNSSELKANFHYDEKSQKFYLETTLKKGDKIEVKIMPFVFASEAAGEDAKIKLTASLNKQNIEDYLTTLTGLLDLKYVSETLSVGDGKLKVKVAGNGSTGFEMIYSNPNLMTEQGKTAMGDEKLAIGMGIFNRNPRGTENSAGILISADSSFSYDIDYGTLSYGDFKLPKSVEIPTTIGLYTQSVDVNGNAVFGSLSTSLADMGSFSAGIGVRRQIGENSTLDLSAVGNSSGEYAASLMFNHSLGDKNVSVSNGERHVVTEQERRDIINYAKNRGVNQ